MADGGSRQGFQHVGGHIARAGPHEYARGDHEPDGITNTAHPPGSPH
jgi:hypothetical protein